MPSFIARKYRYADGVIYNPNRYGLYRVEAGTRGDQHVGVGGALMIEPGKVIAYAGLPVEGGSVEWIMRHAVHYVWGDDLKGALAKIRPVLEARSTADATRTMAQAA